MWGFVLALAERIFGRWLDRWLTRRDAKREADLEGRINDFENAKDLRDRVDRNRDDRMRELDDAGYRDD